MSGRLYVVATPIGNLEDLSARAASVLGSVDQVLAEDTRRTGRLLDHLGLSPTMRSLHEHNESEQIEGLLEALAAGQDLALVSDAGTPLISDPGFELVRAASEAGFELVPVAGPCAAIVALSVSGLPADRFVMEGFLPAKAEARRKRIAELAGEPRTLILYESVHRIAATLADLAAILGADRPACVARELTKLHETLRRADLATLSAEAEGGAFDKGEIVLVVGGAPHGAADAVELKRVLDALASELPPSKAAKVAAELTGRPRRELYRMLGERDD